jgi:hypothetical protein
VYEKTQMKILKNSSFLCGLHADVMKREKVRYVAYEERIQCVEEDES